MNRIDFTQPNGFPLEAEGLEFMQNSYIQGLSALAKLAGQNNVILMGLDDNGTTVSDGWVLFNNELFFFQGGLKSSDFVIEETVTSLNNANGQSVPRYFKRVLKFGAGAISYAFGSLKRVQSLFGLQEKLSLCLFESGVIISGCSVVSVNNNLITIGSGVVKVEDSFFVMPSYQGAYPVYIGLDGKWSNAVASPSDIGFEPYTSQYLVDVFKRNTTPIGEMVMRAVLSDQFDNTGLGVFSMKGWAMCNGQNGTPDMRGRTVMGYDERVNDPSNGIWDSLYNNIGDWGGEKAHKLTIDEMPRHNHQEAGDPTGNKYQEANAGDYGLMRRSITGEDVTVASDDATGAGFEPDLHATPMLVPYEGADYAHENRPPFTVVAFLQRILI